AWTNDGGTGSIGIDINNSRTFIGDSWNHELGHNLASSLEVLTDDNFDTVFESFNPTWFDYESQLEAKGGVTASYKDTATRAIYEWIVNRKYSTRSLEEDQADTFSLLWRGEGVPSANDQAHGTPLSAKRTAWIEQIDVFVPGFKRYAIGMWSEGKYYPKIVPADRGVFNAMLKDGYYSFK
ncbi:hypothetical protein CYG49_02455, partial [Candidatus Saccharibacteria bacterium]